MRCRQTDVKELILWVEHFFKQLVKRHRMTNPTQQNVLYRMQNAQTPHREHTFMILHCATPVTVRGTPCDVSTPSHIGFSVITSSERRCTSVTSHQAHAQPPTIVRFFVEPQHPPVNWNENSG